MNQEELLTVIQSFVANDSISASSLRGQGAKGVVQTARQFLSSLDLLRFGTSNQNLFIQQLNDSTDSLKRQFPSGAKNWGAARKALNIFLRNAYYNQFLCARFNLELSASFYEVPMDSIVASQLRELDKDKSLPRWRGVKYLDKATNVLYQDFLERLAQKYGVQRVHLDAYLWQKLGRALTSRSS